MAVSQKLELRFVTPGVDPAPDTVFTFDVPGAAFPRFVPRYRDASENGSRVEWVETVIECGGLRLLGHDVEDLHTKVATFRALISSELPPEIRLVSGSTTLWTISSPTYERIRVQELRGHATDELMPGGTWLRVAPFTLVISAVEKKADARGIVVLDQSVRYEAGPSGLLRVTYRTRIETVEGTDAREKLRTYGVAPQQLLGDTFLFQTNDTSGLDIEHTDADEDDERIPTVAEGVSVVQEFGVSVGATGPGGAPGFVSYEVSVKTDKDTVETTYLASAEGPGAYAWVIARRPGNYVESEVSNRSSARFASGRWVARTSATSNPNQGITNTIVVELTGGHQSFDYEVASDGFDPVEFQGGLEPWQVTVRIRVERTGSEGTNDDLSLPVMPPAIGLRLDYGASVEKEPEIAERGVDPGSNRWVRDAMLVYRSARKPNTTQVRAALENSATERTPSFWLVD